MSIAWSGTADTSAETMLAPLTIRCQWQNGQCVGVGTVVAVSNWADG